MFLMNRNRHTFHILETSPWPFLASLSVLSLMMGTFFSLIGLLKASTLVYSSLVFLLLTVHGWFSDIMNEGLYNGFHTLKVKRSLRLGMILFIISEVMLFFSFFWAFFYASLAPTTAIGCVYPPFLLTTADSFGLPLVNTLILITSGFSLTCAHSALVFQNRLLARSALVITINLALFFLLLQGHEYIEVGFSICSGIYGSNFFLITAYMDFML